MPPDPYADGRAALQRFIEQEIPITAAMQVQVHRYADDGLTLTAPLAPNRNDKHTAFGGSLAALATLSGWGLLWLEARQRGVEVELVIRRIEISYRRPVGGDLVATCPTPDRAALDAFFDAAARGDGAGITLMPAILDDTGRQAVRFEGQFNALKRKPT